MKLKIIKCYKSRDKLIAAGIDETNTLLLYGPPGCGKTTVAKYISMKTGLPLITARLDGLISSLLGSTAKNIRKIFDFASRQECILFLDEFDVIAKVRDDKNETGELKRVVNSLIQNIDIFSRDSIIIAATNHHELLDPAIWRRFDVQVEIPKPSPQVTMALIRKFLSPLNFADNEIKLFAWCLEDSTGADIEMLAKWVKRAFIIDKESTVSHIIKQFVLLNSGRVNEKKKSIILKSDEEFINALIEDETYTFKQVDIAPMFGMTTSSLSKLKSKMK